MKLTNPGTVPIYTISGADTARQLPDYLARRRKRSLKNDPEFANRVELLQDFEFEEASSCVRVSDDGNWAMSTGTYKPQIHVHHLPQLSLSFARHTTSLNITFVLLSRDYSKSIHLQSDRKVELHTPAGCHHELRLPRYGRDLVYDRISTEALVPAVGLGPDGSGEVFRLNLELGRFMKSYQVDVGQEEEATGLQGSIGIGSVNCAAIAENSHNLLSFGTSNGSIEFWDPRVKTRAAKLDGLEGGVTALDFSSSGLSIAAGTSDGVIQIFDLRRPAPLLRKDQGYGYPIKNLIHLTTASQEKKILSADRRIIKIWDEETGDPWTSVEPAVDINFVTWCKDTGMLLTANEGKQQHSFLIPQLGPSPSWCSFLDNMVEEMAEDVRTETYDNYKFLTVPQLKDYSLDGLIGKSTLLRPYMHGYFVSSKLYEQARLIANPYVFEEERVKRIKEKVEKERASRIRGNKKVKVNQKMVDKLLKRQERREKVDIEAGILGDGRFGKLFEDEDFFIDENSKEFRALNPSTKVTDAAGNPVKNQFNMERDEILGDDSGDDAKPAPRKRGNGVVMKVSSSASGHARPAKDSSFGARLRRPIKGRVEKVRSKGVVGEQQVTFVPERKKSHKPEVAQPVSASKRSDIRRSASSNVLRKL